MRELTPFEDRLASGLAAVAGPRRDVDASTIAQKAIASGPPTSRLARALGSLQLRGACGQKAVLLRLAVAAVALVIATLVVVAVGTNLIQPPMPDTTSLPSPEASTLMTPVAQPVDCQTWQLRAQRAATGWTAGRAPGPLPSSGAGAIAVVSGGRFEVNNVVVGSDPVIGLLDPTTGAYCAVLSIPDYDVIDAGPIWSADGSALAFVASIAPGWAAEGELAHEVFVLSGAGVFRSPGWGVLRWSPDGRGLSALQSSTSVGAFETTVRVYRADGTASESIELCNPCRARNVVWNALGTRIAAHFEAEPDAQTGPRTPGIAVVDLGTGAVTKLPGLRTLDGPSGGQLMGWIDEATLLGVRMDGHGFGISITNPPTVVALGPGYATDQTSPDGSRVVASVEGLGRDDAFVVRELATGNEVTIASGPDLWGGSAWWSPDGRLVLLQKFDVARQSLVDGIWIVEADGRNLRHLTTLEFRLAIGGWQPSW